VKTRAGANDPRTHLLIGPWTHGVEETAITKAGEREFGPTATINYDELILRWMDHYIRGIEGRWGETRPLLRHGG
jgi:hypothetical protein